jgi:nucleoside triphosphate diphosphatase
MSPIEKLLEVMARLRDPRTGCPWDREQDFSSIAPYTIEEAYEVADAIARDDMAGLRDELGDLLLQVVFHARMAEEAGRFSFDDVARGIGDKMIRRHPHVFGSEKERERGAVEGSWETIKARERAAADGNGSALDGIAAALPALLRAEKLGKRAARTGFDWRNRHGPAAKIEEELAELRDAACGNDRARVEEELGDLLFAVANLARHLDVAPEAALSRANAKFEKRFRRMEQDVLADGHELADLDIDTLEGYWQRVKAGIPAS